MCWGCSAQQLWFINRFWGITASSLSLIYLPGWLEWTPRVGAIQLPAGFPRGRSSRASPCSAGTRAKERVPGTAAFLSVCTPCHIRNTITVVIIIFYLIFHHLHAVIFCSASLILPCGIFSAPPFPAWPCTEAQTKCSLWDLIVSVFRDRTAAAQWSPLVSPTLSLFTSTVL